MIDQFPDDLFSPDDFDSEFTEEVKTDSLPQLSSPRRQSTNQSFGKPVIMVIRDFKTTPVIFIYQYFMFCESFQEISGKIIFMFLLVLLPSTTGIYTCQFYRQISLTSTTVYFQPLHQVQNVEKRKRTRNLMDTILNTVPL